LVSTAAGLSVAIPCHGAFNLLLIKVDRLVLDMERASLDVVSYLRSSQRGDTA
jgi:biopolymer transport protein ExbB/TolQ